MQRREREAIPCRAAAVSASRVSETAWQYWLRVLLILVTRDVLRQEESKEKQEGED